MQPIQSSAQRGHAKPVTAPVRFPRFFVTSPAPCPYLPGKSERKVFTELKGPHADQLNDALGRIGFRRSQTVAYRPELRSIARPAFRCAWSRTNSQPVVHAEAQSSSAMAIWSRPNAARGRPTSNSNCCSAISACAIPVAAWRRWTSSIMPTWSSTRRSPAIVIEYREPTEDGAPGPPGRRLPDRPAGRRVVDDLQLLRSRLRGSHGSRQLHHPRSHPARPQGGLPYVYLGYWVDGQPGCNTRCAIARWSGWGAMAGNALIRRRADRRGHSIYRHEKPRRPSGGRGLAYRYMAGARAGRG